MVILNLLCLCASVSCEAILENLKSRKVGLEESKYWWKLPSSVSTIDCPTILHPSKHLLRSSWTTQLEMSAPFGLTQMDQMMCPSLS